MKRLFSIVTLVTIVLTVQSAFGQEDNVLGTWVTADKKAHVKMYASDGVYFGKIIWLAQPNDPTSGKPLLDTKNPDASKRSQPILGSIIFYNFTYDDGEYTGGKIYDARDGKTYTAKIWLNENGTLSMRGYIGFLYGTETWTRLK